MALKIRLARAGSKKRPYYHVVVADVRAPRDGRFIERLGAYNPLLAKDDEQRFTIKEERVKHWLSKGAKPTDRVARYLAGGGIVEWKVGNNPNKAKPGKKAQERLAEKEAEKQAAADAAKAEVEAPIEVEAPTEEAPAEEAAAEEEKAE